MTPIPRTVYQQGDHVCTLNDSPEEQFRAAIEYIQGGLARDERCLYVFFRSKTTLNVRAGVRPRVMPNGFLFAPLDQVCAPFERACRLSDHSQPRPRLTRAPS